jgi:acyl-CoA thioesterase YciA
VVFHCPVRVGQIVSLWAETLRIGRTSVTVRVQVIARQRGAGEDQQVTTAEVTMVSIDEDGEPVPIFQARAGAAGG